MSRVYEVEHLHQPGGWLSPGYVEIGDDGIILSVSGDDSRENLLSSGDLQTALVRFDEAFPFELVYRPLC